MVFNDSPLDKPVKLLVGFMKGKALVWDDDALAVARKARSSFSCKDMPTLSALYRLLKPHGLRFTIEGDEVRISVGASGPPREEIERVESYVRVLDAPERPFSDLRGHACRMLGNLEAASAVPTLIRALEDDDAKVRAAAAEALALIGYRAALLRALRSPSVRVQAGAVRALGRIANRADVRAVQPQLSAPDEDVRAEAAVALGRLGDKIAASSLAYVLREDSAAMRLAAARGLVIMGGERARDALTNALADEDAAVRQTAAIGLVKSGHKLATKLLTDFVSEQRLERFTKYRVTAAMRSDEERRRELDTFFEGAQEDEARAAWALLALRDAGNIEFFAALLQSDDARDVEIAAMALGTIDHASTLPILERALESKERSTKRAVEDAIRRIRRRSREKDKPQRKG